MANGYLHDVFMTARKDLLLENLTPLLAVRRLEVSLRTQVLQVNTWFCLVLFVLITEILKQIQQQRDYIMSHHVPSPSCSNDRCKVSLTSSLPAAPSFMGNFEATPRCHTHKYSSMCIFKNYITKTSCLKKLAIIFI